MSTIMLWFGILFMIACALWLSRPLLKPHHTWLEEAPPPDLTSQSHSILMTLTDLKTDYLNGKISPADFQKTSTHLQAKYLASLAPTSPTDRTIPPSQPPASPSESSS